MRKIHVTRQFFLASGRHEDFFGHAIIRIMSWFHLFFKKSKIKLLNEVIEGRINHLHSSFQTSVSGRENVRKTLITTVSEKIFETCQHELMSRILSYGYRKQFTKVYVSNLRRPIVNRRLETTISENSFFELQFHPLKIIGHSIFCLVIVLIMPQSHSFIKKVKNQIL